MELKYFGTDGIRGRAYETPLSIDDSYRWGLAWASVAKNNNIQNLVIGWDGRTSCETLLQAFLTGFGKNIKREMLGIVPTPAVSWITSRQANTWGLVISASHNPPEDNGLKGFDSRGTKLTREIELAIEKVFVELANEDIKKGAKQQTVGMQIQPQAMESYLAHLGCLQIPDSFPIVIDCAHGATPHWAGRIFSGAIHWIGTPTDGKRINVGVGSTHLQTLRDKIYSTAAAAGIAFDGDGDRCLILNDKGELIDGDQMLWLLALEEYERGNRPRGIIGTVMSNAGLEESLKSLGIPFVRTPVGDKFMVRELDNTGWNMAAEASGHLIQRHLGTSGDGLATALSVLRILLNKPAENRWDWCFKPWSLKLVNIETTRRKEISTCPALQKTIEELNSDYGESVRLVIRWSGTEPLLRIMVEARENDLVERASELLATAAKDDLLL